MRTDYKINNIREDGITTRVTGRIYEGDYEMVTYIDPATGVDIVRREYVRTKKLRDFSFEYPGNFNTGTEADRRRIRGELNAELAKDMTREPIPEQKNDR